MSKKPAGLLLSLAILVSGCGSHSDPAATVDGHDIAMNTYIAEVHYERIAQRKETGYDVCAIKGLEVACRYLKRQALTGVIDRQLIQEYATRHHLAVTKAEDTRNWLLIYQGKFNRDPRQLNAFVKGFGIGISDLRSRLTDQLLRQKVLYDVTKNMPFTAPAIRLSFLRVANKQQLTQVQQELHSGVPFNAVAKRLATDRKGPCARGCGDLGWIPRRLVPPTAPGVAAAQAGALIGPQQLQTGGYTYYDVEASRRAYTLTQQQQISLRGLLFDDWLKKQERQAQIKRFVTV